MHSTARPLLRGRRQGEPSPLLVRVAVWCLSPAVAFQQLDQATHAVVLTSGTLSPTDSFSSEVPHSSSEWHRPFL